MKESLFWSALLGILFCLSGCADPPRTEMLPVESSPFKGESAAFIQESLAETGESFIRQTPIHQVMQDPAFGGYGRLIFPANTGYYSGNTLEELRLTWYSHIDPDKKAKDPAKRDTGLFFSHYDPAAVEMLTGQVR